MPVERLPEKLHAITMPQPHASLIVAGIQRYEFRDRWHALAGHVIAIYAGIRLSSQSDIRQLVYQIEHRAGLPFSGTPLLPDECATAERMVHNYRLLPRAALLGTVVLAPAVRTIDVFNGIYGVDHWTAADAVARRWAWPLLNSVRREPQRCLGSSGFFMVATPAAWLREKEDDA